jgi:predicted NBD/HSP70 family sugar kinase
VIEALSQRGVASRAEIARITGLSRSTVSSLVTDLQRAGLVAERPGENSTDTGQVGRPPVLVALDRSAGAVVGVDFGHSHIAVAVADLSHTVLAEHWQQIDVDHNSIEGLDAAAALVDQALTEAAVDRSQVLGVGMGIPGPISGGDRQIVGSPSILPSWVGINAAVEMERRLSLPVRVENDANLGALAEWMWGAGRGFTDIAYIKASSGVGAGLVVGGRLHRGVGGTAGEIGHTHFRDEGDVCRCGNRGCVETVARTDVITSSISAGRGRELTVSEVIDLARAGDPPAQRVIGDAGRYIGVAVANLCNLLNPQRVIVGGELSVAGEVLLGPLSDSLSRYAIPTAAADVSVVTGELGKRAEVMGALALVLREPEQGLSSTVAQAVGSVA